MKKQDVAQKMKKPRLHYGSVNFTASNPSYKKAQKGKSALGFSKHKVDVEGQKSYKQEDK
jgi:hypothetical protein